MTLAVVVVFVVVEISPVVVAGTEVVAVTVVAGTEVVVLTVGISVMVILVESEVVIGTIGSASFVTGIKVVEYVVVAKINKIK